MHQSNKSRGDYTTSFVKRIKREYIDYNNYHDLSRPINDVNLILGDHQINPMFNDLDLPTVWFNFNGEKITAFRSGVLSIPTNICTHIDFPGHLAYNTKRKPHIFDELKYYVGKCIVFNCCDIIKKHLEPFLDGSGYLNTQDPKKFLDIIRNLEISSDYFKQKILENFEYTLEDLKNHFVIFYTGLDTWRHQLRNSATRERSNDKL